MQTRRVSFIAGLSLAGMLMATTMPSAEGQVCPTPRLHGEAYRQMRDAAFARAGISTSKQCHEGDTRWDCVILDHIWPVCACGPNTLENLQIQRRDVAATKDTIERAYCEGRITLEDAIHYFVRTSP